MAPLHNRVSRKELKQRLLQDTTPRTTISFYRYFKISDAEIFRNTLYRVFNAVRVLGRIYLAHEGINAQVSVPTENFDVFKSYLYSIEPLNTERGAAWAIEN